MVNLKLNNISFKYGKKDIFNRLSISIKENITLLLGANGSGKSTLFKLICGVLLPTNGTIEVYSEEEILNNKSAIAYIPQNFDAFPSLKVYDLLTYICGERNHRLTKKEIKRQVDEAIEKTDIGEYAYKKMRTLSGGTKQRVGIAQSILGNPKIIVADEPTAGLDPEQRERYNHLVKKIAEGCLLVISTHLFEDAQYYDNFILLSKGKMCFQGTKEEMLASVDKKVYQLICERSEFDKNFMHDNFKLLSISENDDKISVRFYSENPPKITWGKIDCAESNLYDAWQYYCGEKNAEN